MRDVLANFHLIRPWWMVLLPVIVGVWWVWQRQTDALRGWRAQMDDDLLQALTLERGTGRVALARCWLIGWLLALLAIAGPTWRLEPSPFADDAAPLMILLKASDSMERGATATSPMERAHRKIADLADVRKGQPLGLIAYAGSAHLVLPPTRDTDVVAQMAAEISPDVMPVPGDRLDLALQEAGTILARGNVGGTVLVIADAVDAEPSAITHTSHSAGSFPVQFLALTDQGTPEAQSLSDAAGAVHARVQFLTVDETDVTTLANAAARQSLTSVTGEDGRWEEAGFWLVPLVVLLVAVAFRREAPAAGEGIT